MACVSPDSSASSQHTGFSFCADRDTLPVSRGHPRLLSKPQTWRRWGWPTEGSPYSQVNNLFLLRRRYLAEHLKRSRCSLAPRPRDRRCFGMHDLLIKIKVVGTFQHKNWIPVLGSGGSLQWLIENGGGTKHGPVETDGKIYFEAYPKRFSITRRHWNTSFPNNWRVHQHVDASPR